jgi:hypothetical protein
LVTLVVQAILEILVILVILVIQVLVLQDQLALRVLLATQEQRVTLALIALLLALQGLQEPLVILGQ